MCALDIRDKNGRSIRPDDDVVYRGEGRTVLSLWIDRDTHTNVTLFPHVASPDPRRERVNGADLEVIAYA